MPHSAPTPGQAATYAKDLAERVAATFAEAFAGTLVAGGWFQIDQITNLSVPKKAAVAGIVAVLAVLKGIVAKAVSRKDSASLAPGV